MSVNNAVVSVVAGVVIRYDRVLLTQSIKGEEWTFPGGKLKVGEVNQKALHREFQEELGGVMLGNVQRWQTFRGNGRPGDVVQLFCFKVTLLGDPMPSGEVVAVRFFKKEECASLSLTEATRMAINALIAEGSL